MKNGKTKVIFRKFNDNDIIAIFPELAGDLNPYTCLSYMHLGQHSACYINDMIMDVTKLAKPEEYEPLKKELENIGYDLKIIVKNNKSYIKKRMEQLK